jgi:heme-degrading monooxygenase HmoA
MAGMNASDSPATSFLSYSRWTLKRGADAGDATVLFRDVVKPAYSQLQGCLGVSLVAIVGSRSYLAIAAWDTRDDYDAWVRQADDWRAEHADAFKQWQAAMDFEEEFQGSIVVPE